MAESLGLGLCRRGSCEGSLRFGWRRRGGEEVDLLRDSLAEVVEGLADVGGVVVRFVRVLGTRQQSMSDALKLRIHGRTGNVRDLKHGVVNLLQGIDSLLKLNVVWWELGL